MKTGEPCGRWQNHHNIGCPARVVDCTVLGATLEDILGQMECLYQYLEADSNPLQAGKEGCPRAITSRSFGPGTSSRVVATSASYRTDMVPNRVLSDEVRPVDGRTCIGCGRAAAQPQRSPVATSTRVMLRRAALCSRTSIPLAGRGAHMS